MHHAHSATAARRVKKAATVPERAGPDQPGRVAQQPGCQTGGKAVLLSSTRVFAWGTDVSTKSERVAEVLQWLESRGSQRTRDEMLTRYGITAPKAFGVKVGAIQQLAKKIGRDHDLAAALWATGWYEARLLTAYIDDPAQVTAAQMDKWARDFDNWGVCDTVCFALFDRTPHAWRKVEQWSKKNDEFVKRAGFALLASLGVHDKQASNEQFLRTLPLIERAATDDRNFVKKGVSWALRVMGRRNKVLHAACVELSKRLAESEEPAARWIGRTGLKELNSAVVQRKLNTRKRTVRK